MEELSNLLIYVTFKFYRSNNDLLVKIKGNVRDMLAEFFL